MARAGAKQMSDFEKFKINEQKRLDEINLHIYLGKKLGFDVSDLIEMRKQRYLKDWGIYK